MESLLTKSKPNTMERMTPIFLVKPRDAPSSQVGLNATKGLLLNYRFGLRFDGVVPLAVEIVAEEIEGVDLGVGDLDALGVGIGVEFTADREAGVSGGCGDELDDSLIADQRPTSPVLGDERK